MFQVTLEGLNKTANTGEASGGLATSPACSPLTGRTYNPPPVSSEVQGEAGHCQEE